MPPRPKPRAMPRPERAKKSVAHASAKKAVARAGAKKPVAHAGVKKSVARAIAKKPATRASDERYSPARRLVEVRTMLHVAGGATVYDIIERLGVSRQTALRYLRALSESGEPLFEDRDGPRKRWSLLPKARREPVSLTTAQMVSLFLSRRVLDFLTGTGFKEDLDDVFEKLEPTLARRDFLAARDFDRKFYDVNEAAHIYEDTIDTVGDVVTALVNDERITATHESVGEGKTRFTIEPYTLLVYKKGLYLAGHSSYHQSVRTFALDGFTSLDRSKGDRFEVPADYHPSRLVGGSFGIIGGPTTRVKIRFGERVARYVRRRRWHATQTIAEAEDGAIELGMEVAGTVEVVSWVLGFGEHAEVLEPASLRDEVARVIEQMRARYRGGSAE